jgi:Ceramidase
MSWCRPSRTICRAERLQTDPLHRPPATERGFLSVSPVSTASLAVTAYCERTAGQFWAEPLNALTNLAFVLAALLIVGQLRRRGGARRPDVGLLAALAAAVGIGSFLWHTLATPWSEWADVIPIGLFISVFLLSFLRRVAGWRWPAVLLAFTAYQALDFLAAWLLPADWLNGSVFYLPAWVSLLLMVVYCRATRRRAAGYVTAMWLVFSLSLLLRSIDAAVCPVFPAGTHFAWHLLNALVLWLAMRLLLD